MKKILIYLLVTISIAHGAIIGGFEADKKEHPWMVYIYDITTGYSCGGVIINEKHVLTAAHCLEESLAKNLVIIPESAYGLCEGDNLCYNPEEVYSATKIVIHEDYRTKLKKPSDYKLSDRYILTSEVIRSGVVTQTRNDIALVQLKTKISENIKPVELVKDKEIDRKGLQILALGRGWTDVDNTTKNKNFRGVWLAVLPKVRDTFWSRKNQLRFFYDVIPNYLTNIYEGENTIMFDETQNKGTCSGDSGGPILIKNKDSYQLLGINSVSSGGRCVGKVGFAVSIPYQYEWIQSTIQDS